MCPSSILVWRTCSIPVVEKSDSPTTMVGDLGRVRQGNFQLLIHHCRHPLWCSVNMLLNVLISFLAAGAVADIPIHPLLLSLYCRASGGPNTESVAALHCWACRDAGRRLVYRARPSSRYRNFRTRIIKRGRESPRLIMRVRILREREEGLA